jgi:glyoxylase-like metal-dependent hydrolase (beta-lactamase superfamily II)
LRAGGSDHQSHRRLGAVPIPVSNWRSEFRVGDRVVLGLADGVFTMTEGFMSVPGFQRPYEDELGNAQFPVGSFVVPGEQTMLIDAGVGPFATSGLTGGALIDELAALDIAPSDIDVIGVSHLHLDHDGWLVTRQNGVTFPNAVIHLGKADYEFFVRDDASEDFRMARHKREGFAELFDAGRMVLVDDTTELVSGVVALPTPGHTPGHLAFAIRDRGERLLVLGDAMYCPAQLTDADLTAMHDTDPAMARRTRELIQREVEAHDTRAVGCHFPGLQAARVVRGVAVAG